MKLLAPSCVAWVTTACAVSFMSFLRRITISGYAIRKRRCSSQGSPTDFSDSRSHSMVTHESGGHHHPPTGFIRKYIFSLDHKVIGIQYYFLALFSVFLGMTLSVLMRFHMVYPDAKVSLFEKLWPTGAPGGVMTPELYLSLMTMHGTIMVFFVLTTAPQSGFGNYFLPIQIGAADMAFPRLNMLSFWTTFLAFVAIVAALFVPGGSPIRGWTAYPPLSGLGQV